MSKTTVSIDNIKNDLDSISGLTGIVSDIMADLEMYIHNVVTRIKENHSEASAFNYYGVATEDEDEGC